MDEIMNVQCDLNKLFSKGETNVTIIYKGATDYEKIKRVVQKVCNNMQKEVDDISIKPNIESIQIRKIVDSETEIRFVCELYHRY